MAGEGRLLQALITRQRQKLANQNIDPKTGRNPHELTEQDRYQMTPVDERPLDTKMFDSREQQRAYDLWNDEADQYSIDHTLDPHARIARTPADITSMIEDRARQEARRTLNIPQDTDVDLDQHGAYPELKRAIFDRLFKQYYPEGQ